MSNNLNFERWAVSKVDVFLLSLFSGNELRFRGSGGCIFEFIKVLRYKHLKISKILMYLFPHEFYVENTSYFDYVPSLVSLPSYERKQ